jgi:hypothetical protein
LNNIESIKNFKRRENLLNKFSVGKEKNKNFISTIVLLKDFIFNLKCKTVSIKDFFLKEGKHFGT